MAVTAPDLTRQLEELVQALDRRVPRAERAAETAIARDSAGLRAKALDQLAQLKTGPAVHALNEPRDPE